MDEEQENSTIPRLIFLRTAFENVEQTSRKNNSVVNARRIFERSMLKVFVSGREVNFNFASPLED